jgi:hypothetical protein
VLAAKAWAFIESALGQTATKEHLERFIEQVSNVTQASSTKLFFETLRIPRSEWPEIVFAWKALLFYLPLHLW